MSVNRADILDRNRRLGQVPAFVPDGRTTYYHYCIIYIAKERERESERCKYLLHIASKLIKSRKKVVPFEVHQAFFYETGISFYLNHYTAFYTLPAPLFHAFVLGNISILYSPFPKPFI